jgi:hypothetical protein
MPDESTVRAWTRENSEAWLKDNPLPTDFLWDRVDKRADGMKVVTSAFYPAPVIPDYRITKGYGFWLRTTPYFPGLFEEIHEILVMAPNDLPLTPEWLAEQLLVRKKARGEQTSFL